MAEFEHGLGDWRRQVEGAVFYTSRKGNVSKGTQHTVYTTQELDFVVKVPNDPRWQQGYWLVEDLAPDLSIPFLRVIGLTVNVDRIRKKLSQEVVVQKKVPEMLDVVIDAFGNHDSQALQRLIAQQSETDLALIRRGIHVPDPTYNNYGILGDGVRRFDFGDARISFTGEIEYANLAANRAGSHFTNYLFLKELSKKFLTKMPDRSDPGEYYASIHQLPKLPPGISSMDDIYYGMNPNTLNRNVIEFMTQVSHEEFQRHAPNGAPFDPNIDALVSYLKSIKN